jgi:hypothetical protein
VLAPAPAALPPVGHRDHGTVVRAVPERDGRSGYLLLGLPGHPRSAMLLAQHMSDDLRAELNNEQVASGEKIYIEVTSVDPVKNKILLRELFEPVADAG